MDAKLAPTWRVGFPSTALLNCPRFLDKETLIRETGGIHAHRPAAEIRPRHEGARRGDVRRGTPPGRRRRRDGRAGRYRKTIEVLTHLAGLPAGADEAVRIAASCREKYPRRRALLE